MFQQPQLWKWMETLRRRSASGRRKEKIIIETERVKDERGCAPSYESWHEFLLLSLSLHFLPLFCLSSTPSIKMLLPIHLAILQQLHHLSLRLLSQKVTQPRPVRAPSTVYMGTRERESIFSLYYIKTASSEQQNKETLPLFSSLSALCVCVCLPLFQMFIWGGRFNTIRERSKSPRRRNKIDNVPFRQ